ncbi:GNAT family N-acetyltransferase [Caballeronia telluris]|jgi:putative hemolysin|uniref:L-ornithine N(alpha)-acyltransferase n=1 Tax=Caballeronia telluris TaxID=326475 RepID=A0A158HNZ0_9BURK|nr:GNAT family N-acyltransferase [Caballeronia telluris]SAL45996.1 putative hemolysin-like protein [Caballeronia telluris]
MQDSATPALPKKAHSALLHDARRRLPRAAETVTGQVRLQVAWARTDDALREAQRLRYRVFSDEMGARLTGPAGLDVDAFDAFCDHLLVRDLDTLKVVGTYRVLPPHQAARIGRLYAESEFDVSRLTHLRPKLVEVGRSCVHPDYRNGAVIMSLWGGLATYMMQNGYETMLGCASVGMVDGGHYAANLYCSLAADALTAPEYRAFPHTPLPVEELRTGVDVSAPPLVKGYLRLGAKICGAPAWDPDFNTADFLTLFRLSDINARYARHFMSDANAR